MQLTRYQLHALRMLPIYREPEYSVLQLVNLSWKYYAWIIGFFGGFALFFYRDHSPVFSAAFGGFAAGALFVDLRHLAARQMLWPLYRKMIDWEAVEQLLAENAGRRA